jgi:aspartate/methionine/tyrosine aminotransferase
LKIFLGPDWGDERLRQALAKWLTDFYSPATPIDVDRLSITGGASQNLGCLLQTFTDPVYTRNIWIVAPAYMLAFRIFDDSGFNGKLRAVPEDDEGLDIEFLQTAIEKSEQEAKSKGNNAPVNHTNATTWLSTNASVRPSSLRVRGRRLTNTSSTPCQHSQTPPPKP